MEAELEPEQGAETESEKTEVERLKEEFMEVEEDVDDVEELDRLLDAVLGQVLTPLQVAEVVSLWQHVLLEPEHVDEREVALTTPTCIFDVVGSLPSAFATATGIDGW